jgi:hypothetical protein
MSHPPISPLVMRLRRTIARRQFIARWSKRIAVPTLLGGFWAGRWSECFAYLVFALFVVEVSAIVVGENQRCPICDTRLLWGRGWNEEFLSTCPECDCPID